MVDRLKNEYAGKVDIYRLDADDPDSNTKKLMARYGIQICPAFAFVTSRGGFKTVIGEQAESTLRARLDALG